MTNQDLHELTAAYALDALDADDRQAFETHLRECERCRAELGELADTVGALAYASEGPAPPESLRDRILVAAREEGRRTSSRSGRSGRASMRASPSPRRPPLRSRSG